LDEKKAKENLFQQGVHTVAYTENKACNGRYVAVVGGVNVDIGGRPFGPLVAKDSNPGKVTVNLGGVGRNIAHNLSLLGIPVKFFTAIGDDIYADRIVKSCEELCIDIRGAKRVKGGSTSTYLFIADSGGDMAAAVSDMSICDEITPEYLSEHGKEINGAAVVVADANIPGESLAWLAERCTAPLFVDPVSTKKAEKLRPILGKIHTLKPNILEAQVLSDVNIRDRVDCRKAAEALLSTGLQRLYISAGSRGVIGADGRNMMLLPCLNAMVKNTTGAGDAFMAALILAYLKGLDMADSCLFGSAAAALTVECDGNINPEMSEESLLKKMAGSTLAAIRI
jgi:pseudouridine kinase